MARSKRGGRQWFLGSEAADVDVDESRAAAGADWAGAGWEADAAAGDLAETGSPPPARGPPSGAPYGGPAAVARASNTPVRPACCPAGPAGTPCMGRGRGTGS